LLTKNCSSALQIQENFKVCYVQNTCFLNLTIIDITTLGKAEL